MEKTFEIKLKGLLVVLLLAVTVFHSSAIGVPTASAQEASVQPEYYRVKITLTTKSDWTKFLIKSDEKIANAKLEVVKGADAPDLNVFWSEKKICISKRSLDTTKVKVECVILMIGLEEDTNINFELQRGSIGYTTVEIYNFNGEKPVLLKKFTRSETVPGSEAVNPFFFPMKDELLMENGPLPSVKARYPKLVWAFYYPWYVEEGWKEKESLLTDRPVLGYYNSSDKSTIWKHIILAEAAGIDGFIVSWWGKDTYSDEVLSRILEVSGKENFKVCIYLETLKDVEGVGVPRSPLEIEEMLEAFFAEHGDSEAYYRLDGKPVVFVWAAGSYTPEVWREIFEDLRLKGYNAEYIAESLDASYLEVFDGLHIYNPITIKNLEEVYCRMSTVCETYSLLEGDGGKIWAATICPGYDERLIPKRAGFYQNRENGLYYRKTFEAARNSRPDWLLITSFNEWPENTYIEPSEKYGFKYILMTEKFTSEFKSRSSDPSRLLSLKADWRKNTMLTISLSKDALLVDEELEVSGRLTPAEPGDIVHILTSRDGESFVKAVDVKVGGDGSFSFRLKPSAAGRIYVKASWDGDGYRRPSQSSIKQATVSKIPTSITVSVSPSKVYRGETVKVTGLLSPAVSGASVTIAYLKKGGDIVKRTVLTASDGSFQDAYRLGECGTWTITAGWEGDEKHQGGESLPAACIVEENPYVIVGWASLIAAIIAILSIFTVRRLRRLPSGRRFRRSEV
ncbi:MAG: endo-1,3-alpha-glucanase family glycosylhydrolase [Candidatus Hecatellaceae archaeon]|nr:MAG: hypothetical protein DRO43_03800 [Candidatus Hecatellales archaeon]